MAKSIGIKPLGSRVLIKKLEAEEKSQGGIILTSSAKEKPQVAEVVAVGPEQRTSRWKLKLAIRWFLQNMQVPTSNMMAKNIQ